MYDTLDLFRISSAMARHAGAQQAMIATNVANADTPGYKATTLPPFTDAYRADGGADMRATRARHMAPTPAGMASRPQSVDGEPSPNGNTVSVEEEMLAAVEAQREHSQALAIYRHAMGIIRTSLGR